MGNIYNEIRQLQYKLVYVTPEKIAQSPGLISTLNDLYKIGKIDRFVIDEVHCVSSWGQDFRGDYLELRRLKQDYPNVPILGLTATATIKVKNDIAARLGIERRVIYFQSSFNRPNLFYEIRNKNKVKNVENDIAELLKDRFRNKSGIIYCTSRKNCETLASNLKRNYGISADYYHAERNNNERQMIQA